MYYYILIFISVFFMAGQFSIGKVYQMRFGAQPVETLKYTCLSALFCFGFLFAVNGFRLEIEFFSILMALGMSAACTAYSLVGFKMMQMGKLSVYTMFLMMGGMLLPYIYGLLFLDEEFSAGRGIGMVLMVTALVMTTLVPEKKHEKNNRLFLICCAAVFILNGFVSIFSKVHQVETELATVGTLDFGMLTNLFNFLLSVAAYAVLSAKVRKKDLADEGKTGDKRNYKLFFGLIFANALAGGITLPLQLEGASHIPAVVQYPIITGGGIILSAFAGALFFRERITKRNGMGIALAFLATICFMF